MKNKINSVICFLVILLFSAGCTKDEASKRTTLDFSYTYVNDFMYVPCVVEFTASGTSAGSYEWDFDDGETSTEKNPTHIFLQAGTFTVKLTSSRSTKSVEKEIEIFKSPKINTLATYKNDTLQYTGIYTYNANGTLARTDWTDNSYETYAYYNGTIEDKYYEDDTMYYSSVYYINLKGLAISCDETYYSSKKSNRFKKNTGRLKDAYVTQYKYTYNSDAYMVKQEVGDYEVYVYSIDNGNRVKTDYTYNSDLSYSYTRSYTFFSNINTIGNENAGIYFLGRQNINLIQNYSTLQNNETTVGQRQYQLDSNQRVATEIIDNSVNIWKYKYTYVE
jgi:PKD repeat protein